MFEHQSLALVPPLWTPPTSDPQLMSEVAAQAGTAGTGTGGETVLSQQFLANAFLYIAG